MEKNNHLLLYDGVCHLCNNTVKFILKNETNQFINFAPLQSELGKKICKEKGIETRDVDSIVYLKKSKVYTKSTAALWISLELKFPYNLLAGFLIFPEPLRNLIYDFIAKKRYQWFGKSDTCIMPDETNKNRFLDL